MKRHPAAFGSTRTDVDDVIRCVLGLASFAYSFNYLVANPNQINDSFGWHMQYLTIIGLSLAASTFAVGLLADLTLSPTLFRIKNTLSIASAPMEVLISILYWALRTIDPGLVMPDWAPVLSLKTDFSFHAIPSVALVVDLLFFSPPYAISALPALGLSSFIALAYWFWTELCYSKNGFYAYPIFEQLDTPGRAALFSGSAVVMAVSTLSLSWLYGKVNGEEMDVKRKPR
ncbi:hypothetical protein H2203_001526 [Taxawa tesnikishii (nom. ined.)]|nr:hypothetical protein H2203_001526 [Dothideales sp. JES 119]